MWTFLGQLAGFAVIVWIIWKFVVPPVRTLMAERQETVRTQLADSARATERLAAADTFHAARVQAGKAEARHIVDEASVDSQRIAEQLRAQGGVEAERIKVYGEQQVLLLRSQLIRELRGELGDEAVRRAGEIVEAYVADPARQSATVDRFLDELESMAPAGSAPDATDGSLRSASRDAQAAVVAAFDAAAGSLSTEALSQLAAELAEVAKLLHREPMLARHLSEVTSAAEAKRQLLGQLLSGRIGAPAMAILDTAVSARWSATQDLVASIEHVATLALLARTEREQQADEVAEQLFRFGRLLDEQPRLAALLSDAQRSADVRVSLLREVLDRASGMNPTTAALLVQTIELLGDERADDAVRDLAQLAVSRQGEIVAQVVAAAELTDAQRRRLADVLQRIYRNAVSVQVVIDPEVLGGLSVAVGDEVIDGTLSSRLAAAATRLPD